MMLALSMHYQFFGIFSDLSFYIVNHNTMIIYYYTCSINWHNFGHNRCIIAAMPKSIIGHMNGIMWTSLVLILSIIHQL